MVRPRRRLRWTLADSGAGSRTHPQRWSPVNSDPWPFSRTSAAIETVSRIDAVPGILYVVRRITGMRFVAVARVTETRWICSSSLDDLGVGLEPRG